MRLAFFTGSEAPRKERADLLGDFDKIQGGGM
jgi:hypothetical protein